MMAIGRPNCFHEKGRKSPCAISSKPYLIIFGIIQIIFSQIPNFDDMWWLSLIAAFMSFIYSFIALAFSIVQVFGKGGFKGSLTGISIGDSVTQTQKLWRILQSFKDIGFAYSYPIILIEIQDTIKASVPASEARVMKKAISFSVAVITALYLFCGCMGYAALGDATPNNNLLAAFSFHHPMWLLHIANTAMIIYLIGVYQVFSHQLFSLIEKWANRTWPDSEFITKEIVILSLSSTKSYKLNLFRLICRSTFVIVTTMISMVLPYLKEVVALAGALKTCSFIVHLPIDMYIVQMKLPKWTLKWICLQILSFACRVFFIASAVGSVAGAVSNLA